MRSLGVREDTVRLWRCDFADGGGSAEGERGAWPSPCEERGRAARRHASFGSSVANRRNWTIARLISEIEAREGVGSAGRNYPRRCEKKLPLAAAAAQLERSPDRRRDRARGLAPSLRKAQAEAGDIVLLYGDESEARRTLIGAGVGQRGADLRVPAPGQAKKVAMIGSLDHLTRS